MATLRRTAVASFGRLGQTNVPTWSLAVLVAVLGWEIGFPTGSHSLDPSWMAGLNMGAHEGLIFGSEIVFTYGPLGFLKGPMVWYSDIAALSYLYQAGTFYFFVLLLILNLRPRIGAVSACVTAFLAIVWLPGIDFAIGIATLWAFYVLSGSEKVQLWPLASVGAVFAAAECLMKLSTGPLILIVMLMTMAGCRAKRLEWVRFGLLFVAAFISLYLIAGQALGDLPDFLRFSYQVVSGYPEGMSDYTQGVSTAIALSFVTAITCVWAWFGSYPDNRRRVAATLVAGAIGFSFYKAGVIRADANHLAISYTTFAILWIAISDRSSEVASCLDRHGGVRRCRDPSVSVLNRRGCHCQCKGRWQKSTDVSERIETAGRCGPRTPSAAGLLRSGPESCWGDPGQVSEHRSLRDCCRVGLRA